MLTFENIFRALSKYQSVFFFSYSNIDFVDLSFLLSNDELKENILYVADDKTLKSEVERLKNISVIVIEEKQIPEDILSMLESNHCSVITCSGPIYAIFNELKALFMKELNFLNWIRQLHNLTLKSKSLEEILFMGEKLLKNPIVIIDESFKIIDYSKRLPVTDELWKKNIKNGYCSYEFIMEVTKSKDVQDAPFNEEAFPVTCPQSTTLKLASKVFIQKKLRGYVIVLICYQDLSEEQLRLIPEISKIVSHQLSHYSIHSYRMLEEKLLLDILEHKMNSRKELTDRVKACGIKFSEHQYLLMLKGKASIKKKHNTSTIQSHLATLFPESKQFIYKDLLLVLISFRDATNWNRIVQEKLTSFLEKYGLKAIKSDLFSDIGELHFIYHQLVESLQLAEHLKKDDSFMEFSTLKFYHLLNEFPNKERLLSYCHPAVLTLYEFDQKNATDYFQTLFTYLHHNQNIQDTSEALYIHRNTMKNRLRKIHELIDINLNVGEVTFQLAYSYKILSYAQHLEITKTDSLKENN